MTMNKWLCKLARPGVLFAYLSCQHEVRDQVERCGQQWEEGSNSETQQQEMKERQQPPKKAREERRATVMEKSQATARSGTERRL
jgi:hypothetical protein